MSPKSKSKPKPKKGLDPKQVFVIQSMTRAEIAEAVNGIFEGEGWDVPKLKKDDPRLTDKFCREYVDGLDSGICDADDVVDTMYRYERACVASEFGITLEEDDE